MSVSSPSSSSAAVPLAGNMRPKTETSQATAQVGMVPLGRSLVVLLLAAVVGLAYWFNPPLNVQPQAGVIMELPVFVGDYLGQKATPSDAELYGLPRDTEFARRIYNDTHGHQIECSIVLSGAEKRSIHRPEACLVGQGWTIVEQGNIPIPLASNHPLVARKLDLERQVIAHDGSHVTVRANFIYWFVGQNVTTPSHFTRILLSDWDRVVHNRAHRWAYVSVFSLVTDNLRADGLDAAKTQSLLVDFAGRVVPSFQISEMPAQAAN